MIEIACCSHLAQQELFVIGKTGRVVQQVTDGDCARVHWKLRAELRQGIFELQLPAISKDHDGHRRKLFGHRPKKRLRVGSDRATGVQVREAEILPINYASVMNDYRSYSRTVFFDVLREHPIETSWEFLRESDRAKQYENTYGSHFVAEELG
jgi:hypothetical protein